MKMIDSWSTLDLSETSFLNQSDSINKIIKPIRDSFGIDCFNYHRTYKDGSQLRLSNKIEWYKYYLSNKLYLNSIFELDSSLYESCSLLWSSIKSHKDIVIGADSFGIHHGVTVINKNEDCCEFFFLGMSNPSISLYNRLMLNVKHLNKFVNYFHTHSQILMKNVKDDIFISSDMAINHTNFKIDEFDLFEYSSELCGVKFSGREKDVAIFLHKGLTAKQIALKVSLSYRTIEEYIINMRLKTGCESKQKLCRYLSDNIFE